MWLFVLQLALGGHIQGAPSLVAYRLDGQATFFLAAWGEKDELVWRTGVGGAWSDWGAAGGVLRSPPSCVSRVADVVDCFVVTSNHRLAQRSFVKGTWGDWALLDPGLVVEGDVQAFARDAEHLTVLASGRLDGGPTEVHALEWVGYDEGELLGRALGKRTAYQPAGWGKWAPFAVGARATAGFACDGRFFGVARGARGRDAWARLFPMHTCVVPDPPGHLSIWVFHGDLVQGQGVPPVSGTTLPRADSAVRADVHLRHTKEDGLHARVAFVSPGGTLVVGTYVFGKGWKATTDLGGALSSAPSCAGGLCVARGADGGVWATRTE